MSQEWNPIVQPSVTVPEKTSGPLGGPFTNLQAVFEAVKSLAGDVKALREEVAASKPIRDKLEAFWNAHEADIGKVLSFVGKMMAREEA